MLTWLYVHWKSWPLQYFLLSMLGLRRRYFNVSDGGQISPCIYKFNTRGFCSLSWRNRVGVCQSYGLFSTKFPHQETMRKHKNWFSIYFFFTKKTEALKEIHLIGQTQTDLNAFLHTFLCPSPLNHLRRGSPHSQQGQEEFFFDSSRCTWRHMKCTYTLSESGFPFDLQ